MSERSDTTGGTERAGGRYDATFAVVLAAAGASRRFRADRPDLPNKPFVRVGGRPLWSFSAERFASRGDVVEFVMAVTPGEAGRLAESEAAWLDRFRVRLVEGGSERAESVANAVAALRSDAEFVAVHDAARPLVDDALIGRVFARAIAHGAAIPAMPVVGTVKEIDGDGRIVRTVPRGPLREAQTPQAGRLAEVRRAFATVDLEDVTDEASLLERAGHRVEVVAGSRENLKVTTADDLAFVEFVLSRRGER